MDFAISSRPCASPKPTSVLTASVEKFAANFCESWALNASPMLFIVAPMRSASAGLGGGAGGASAVEAAGGGGADATGGGGGAWGGGGSSPPHAARAARTGDIVASSTSVLLRIVRIPPIHCFLGAGAALFFGADVGALVVAIVAISAGRLIAPVCCNISITLAKPQPWSSVPSTPGCRISARRHPVTAFFEAGWSPNRPFCVPVIVCSMIAKPSTPQAPVDSHFWSG